MGALAGTSAVLALAGTTLAAVLARMMVWTTVALAAISMAPALAGTSAVLALAGTTLAAVLAGMMVWTTVALAGTTMAPALAGTSAALDLDLALAITMTTYNTDDNTGYGSYSFYRGGYGYFSRYNGFLCSFHCMLSNKPA